jgi:mono/diheme cytochrome c family protein
MDARLLGMLLLAVAPLIGNAAAARADTSPVPAHAEAAYRRYCASCHGMEGRGDGPVAETLDPRPTDLTRLSAGVAELMRAIDGRRTIRAHGTASMPVWGRVFEESAPDPDRRVRQALREEQAIAEYVRSLQAHGR